MKDRKWEMSKQEIEFEKILKDNGVEILDVKEYKTKTKYTLKKNGTEIQIELPLSNQINIKGFTKMVLENLKMASETKRDWVDELLEKGEVHIKIKL